MKLSPVKACLLLVLLGLQSCTSMLFYPMPEYVRTPDSLGIAYDNMDFNSTDGTHLHGWWLHARGKGKGTILFLHGNAQNISTHIGHVYWLVDYGYDVAMIDYRGYGQSGGKVDLAGSIQDIRAAVRYVSDHLRIPDHGLVVMGQSLGASMSVAALAEPDVRRKIRALVVVGGFSDYRRITQHVLSTFWLTWPLQWPLSFTVNNQYSPEDYIGRIAPVPVLIMQGMKDDVIPIANADRLYQAAKQPRYLEKLPGDHNHLFEYGNNKQVLLKYLKKFLE